MLLVGPRGCGKTSFVNKYCQETLKRDAKHVFARFTGCSPRSGAEATYCTSAILNEIIKEQISLPDRHATIILDDMPSQLIHDLQRELRQIALNGAHHYRITLIITAQYPLRLSPEMRVNIDYTVMWPMLHSALKSMYDLYFGIIPSFSAFNGIVRQLTKRNMLVMDSRKDCISCCKIGDIDDDYVIPEQSMVKCASDKIPDDGDSLIKDKADTKQQLGSILQTLQTLQDQIKALL